MSSAQHILVMDRLDFGIKIARENRSTIESASRSIKDSKDTIFFNNVRLYCNLIEDKISRGVNELRSSIK